MIEPGQNTGFIAIPPKPTAYIAGAQIPEVIRNPKGDWRTFEPDGENQKLMGPATITSSTGFETNACVSFSACDTVEVFIDWLIAQGKVPQETVDWLKSNGYFDSNGKLNTSDRFVAKVSNTTIDGNGLEPVGDAVRHYGLVPESMWPFPIEAIQANPQHAWDIYYASVPQRVLDMGQEFLKRFAINYEWVFAAPGTATPTSVLNALKVGPLQVATAVCTPWNTANVIQGCGSGAAHATCLAYVDSSYHILDHYPPYHKFLALNYDISYAMRYIVTPTPAAAVVDAAQKVVSQLPALIEEINTLPADQQPYWKAVLGPIFSKLASILSSLFSG